MRVGTESQPTLRAEREALSLLHFLRDALTGVFLFDMLCRMILG